MSSFADRKAVYTSRKWRNMRREIVKAAGNRCSQCGERHTSRLLELHHITPLEEAPELAFQINNLMLVCRGCHRRQHGLPSWMTRATTSHRQSRRTEYLMELERLMP